MTTSQVVTLVAVAVWLGVLTVVTLLLLRQVSLLTVNLGRLLGSTRSFDVAVDGPDPGTVLPTELEVLAPELQNGLGYVLLVSATCTPCRLLALELDKQRSIPKEPIIALVPGRLELAAALVDYLPDQMRAIQDPTASDLAAVLNIQSTPFVVEVEGGIVTRRSHVQDIRELMEFVKQQEDRKALAPLANQVPVSIQGRKE